MGEWSSMVFRISSVRIVFSYFYFLQAEKSVSHSAGIIRNKNEPTLSYEQYHHILVRWISVSSRSSHKLSDFNVYSDLALKFD